MQSYRVIHIHIHTYIYSQRTKDASNSSSRLNIISVIIIRSSYQSIIQRMDRRSKQPLSVSKFVSCKNDNFGDIVKLYGSSAVERYFRYISREGARPFKLAPALSVSLVLSRMHLWLSVLLLALQLSRSLTFLSQPM